MTFSTSFRRKIVSSGSTFVLALGMFVGGTQLASACVDRTALATPPTVIFTQIGVDQYQVHINNYGTTFGSALNTFCGCGLRAIGPIAAVNSVRFIDANTGIPIPGFTFVANAATTDGLNLATGEADIQGFLSDITTTIPAGIVLSVVMDVTTVAGTTDTDLVNAVGGATNFIASDEANANGTLANTHLASASAGDILGNMIATPMIGVFGITGLAAALGGIGFTFQRRKVNASTL